MIRTLAHEILFLTLIFLVTFVFILPTLCQDLGFSIYFIPSNDDEITIDRINEQRTKKAEHTLNILKRSSSGINIAGKKDYILDFSIVLISVWRKSNSHYLLQTATRLMEEVHRDGGKSDIVIFNADKRPDLNKDAVLLSEFVKIVNRSKTNHFHYGDIFEKEKQDYVRALEIALQSNSYYVLVVEDDALANEGVLWKIRYILNWKMPWIWLRSSNSQNWAFLKLYYPEKWQGFGNPEIPELLLIGVLGAFAFMVLRRRIVSRQRTALNKKMKYVWYVAGLLYFVLVAYTVGRTHWIEMRKVLPLLYSVGRAPGCCTPAVLFPTKQARNILKFLNATNCRAGYPVDLAFDDFAKTNNLTGLLLSPNLFTHIGFHSSLADYKHNPREFKLLFEP